MTVGNEVPMARPSVDGHGLTVEVFLIGIRAPASAVPERFQKGLPIERGRWKSNQRGVHQCSVIHHDRYCAGRPPPTSLSHRPIIPSCLLETLYRRLTHGTHGKQLPAAISQSDGCPRLNQLLAPVGIDGIEGCSYRCPSAYHRQL